MTDTFLGPLPGTRKHRRLNVNTTSLTPLFLPRLQPASMLSATYLRPLGCPLLSFLLLFLLLLELPISIGIGSRSLLLSFLCFLYLQGWIYVKITDFLPFFGFYLWLIFSILLGFFVVKNWQVDDVTLHLKFDLIFFFFDVLADLEF